MKNIAISSRIIRVVYQFALPAITIIFLLIVSQNMKRPLFLASFGWDLFARIWIILGYCSLYIRLSDLEKYMFRVYRIMNDHSNEDNLPWNRRNIFLGSLLGVVSIPFTWWIIQFFLPKFSEASWLLALATGVILSIPMMIWRSKLVL